MVGLKRGIMSGKNILRIVMYLLLLGALAFVSCIPFAAQNNERVWPYVLPAVVLFLTGLVGFYNSKKITRTLTNKEYILIITGIWVLVLFTGTFPYLLGNNNISFADIWYETISGITSTGSTVFYDPEILPKSLLLWRSLSQWYGGVITIVMLLALFPVINLGGYQVFSTGENKIRLVTGAFVLYSLFTFLQVLLFLTGGMGMFKSLCISFGTVSSGCFLPDKSAVSEYSSFNQSVMIVFMFLSGLGGVLYFQLAKLKFSGIKKSEEVGFYLVGTLLIILVFAYILYPQYNQKPTELLRSSVFQAVSFLSSCGYDIADYSNWPHYFKPLLYVLIVVGGCSNSPGGGIRISRFLLLLKNIKRQFKNPVNDSETEKIKYNNIELDEVTNLNILTFISIFGLVLVLGTLTMSFITNDLQKSVYLTVTSLSTFGHSINLSDLPHAGKIVLGSLMFIGRLEIFPLFLLITPTFYKKSEAFSV